MLSRARTAMKFFTWGLVAGLLFAPNSGAESRERLKAKILRRDSE